MPEKEESIIQIVAVGTLLLLLVGSFIISFLFLYGKRQKKHQIEKLAMQNNFQQELLRTQLEIQEQTLKNISQEIHDNIGQTLSLAKLNLNTMDVEKATTVDKIHTTKELVGKAIHDLRDLSRSLNTDSILSAGLVKAIEIELGIIEKAGVFEIRFSVSGKPIRIDPKKELILFRIIQEAINNIIKHSNASLIKVDLDFRESGLEIIIADNGRGFAFSEQSDGSGLRNMNSRAQLIGGSLEVNSSTNGTTIILNVPITEI